MRPVFDIPLQSDGQKVLRRLDELLQSDVDGVVGQVVPRYAVLQLAPDRRTLLSPFLNIEVQPHDSGTVLKGRFSPHPNVWTGFMAIYGVLAMLGLLSALWGLSEWWAGGSAFILLGAPAAAGAIAFVYGAALIGQGLTADEMYDLRALVDRAVREADA